MKVVIIITGDDDETDDTVMDVLEPNPEYENEVLLAKQKTLMWSEEQYLTLAPGMNQDANKYHIR